MNAFAETPINQFLGLQLVQSNAEGGKVALPDCAHLTQEGGVVHGGILSALADTAAVYAVIPHLADGASMTSIEFKMNFFRPGRAGGGELVATAKILKAGRTVNVCESKVMQGEKELAHGVFTYLVMANPETL